MSDKSRIEWTDATWNPIRGCSRVSEGCRNCYAERMAARFSDPGQPYHGLAKRTRSGPRWTGKVVIVPGQLEQPQRWKEPRMIFVNSMSDLFHESLTFEQIALVCVAMECAPQHIYQILSKRAERMRRFFNEFWGPARANWWIGTSVEDQPTAIERIPELMHTRARIRWISAEPLLGPIDLTTIPECVDLTRGAVGGLPEWVVAGGESGPGARPMHIDWVRALRDQCQAARIPFFFKQWGEWAPLGHLVDSFFAWKNIVKRSGKKKAGRILDGRTWDEYPSMHGASHAPTEKARGEEPSPAKEDHRALSEVPRRA